MHKCDTTKKQSPFYNSCVILRMSNEASSQMYSKEHSLPLKYLKQLSMVCLLSKQFPSLWPYGFKIVVKGKHVYRGAGNGLEIPSEYCFTGDKGHIPFNKNHWFKFSIVEWNMSDRFPEFEVTCSITQGMLGETFLCFAALEQDDCETISCNILNSNDVILLAAVACFMQREST